MQAPFPKLAVTPGSLAHLLAEVPESDLDALVPDRSVTLRQILMMLRERESAGWRRALEDVLAGRAPEPFDADAWMAGMEATAVADVPVSAVLPKRRIVGDIALQRQASINRLEQLDDAARDGLIPLAEAWLAADAEAIAAIERALGTTLAEIIEQRFSNRD